MQSSGATIAARTPLHSRQRLRNSSAPPLTGTLSSVISTFRWRPTRRLSNHGAFEIVRVSASGGLGPGCYVLKTAKSTSSVARALLQREALVASHLNHSSLIAVLAAECTAAVPHLVLPYLEGITLRRLLESAQTLRVSFALCIVRQIAAALAAMHAAGWLHGQVRPEHFIISPQGHATLIDLTRACRLESAECDATGVVPASPIYAAPETTLSRGRLTAAADVYSLGIVLYEALTGQPPFQHASPRELMRCHCRDAVPDIRNIRPDVSLEVSKLCDCLLAKEPLRRPGAPQALRWLAEIEIETLSV